MIKINNVNYSWNQTEGGALLDIGSEHSSGIFFSYLEIDVFLNGLTKAAKTRFPDESVYNEVKIPINSNLSVEVDIDRSYGYKSDAILYFSFARGHIATSMMIEELLTLISYLNDSKYENRLEY